ncbi:MAG TPA: hypothetical protein VF667_01640 [Pseudonocardia sp.]
MPPPLSLPHRSLDALARGQAGVVSRAQALAAGLAPAEVDRCVARRRWRPLHPRVYLVAGHPLTDEARVWAAALWAGEGAVVVGAAALWWHGAGARAPATVAVAVPHRTATPRPGVAVRRRVLRPADVVRVRGLAVPVRALALLDAAVDAGSAGAELLHRVLRDGAPADGALEDGAPGDGVDPVRLRAVVGSAAGTASALRLVRDLPAAAWTAGATGRSGVTSTAGAPLPEWARSRNRYSEA